MPYEEVPEPIRGLDAFRATGDAAILSQAAILLLLGAQLRGNDYFLQAIPESDRASFPVPHLVPTGERFGFERVRSLLQNEIGADVAQRLYSDPNPMTAAQLLEIYLHHPDELLRVAAATSYFDLSAEPSRLL